MQKTSEHNVGTHLEVQGFIRESALNHQEMIAFIALYLFRKNLVTNLFLWINILLLATLIWRIAVFIQLPEGSLLKALLYFVYGTLMTIIFIAPHELIHGLGYLLCGARKISFSANWKQLYFMAMADKFVVTKKQFYFIALLPFLIITLCLIVLVFFSSPDLQIMWLSAAFIHATMCAGDFGLMSFFETHHDKEIVTYDDIESNMSYFYSKPRAF